MNNPQLAHQWAAQSKPEGKGSSFWYEGRTIYSYGRHFAIATFTDRRDSDGRQIVLFTTRSYSITTARHISLARSALHGLPVRVVMVPEVSGAETANTLRGMAGDYNAEVAKAARARVNAEHRARAAQRIRADMECFAAAFGFAMPELPAISPETLQAARAAAKRASAETRKRNAERAAMREAGYQDDIHRWRAGESVALWQYSDKPTALRLSRDGLHVETSRGASVTLRTARNLWRALQSVRGADAAARAELVARFPSVDGFTLREIRDDGAAVIGCHTLHADEVDAFAAARGWSAAAAVAA